MKVEIKTDTNENVYQMMNACKRTNSGRFYSKKNLPKQVYKGDILFSFVKRRNNVCWKGRQNEG